MGVEHEPRPQVRHEEERVRALVESLHQSLERYKNLTAAAFDGIVITQQGKIVDTNEQLAQMLGYERAELLGKEVMSFVAPDARERVASAMRSGHGAPYEHLAVCKDGSLLSVEVRGKIVQFGGREARVTAIRDVSQRRRLEDAVHSIVLGTSVVGAEFFTALVRGVTSTLGVRQAFVAELSSEPASMLRTLALWVDGQPQGPLEFALAGTPCEAGFQEPACCYSSGVRQLFPRDALLAHWGAQSYLGVPLFSAAGAPLGWLAAVHDRPLEQPHLERAILTIFAGRAAAELERLRAEQQRAELQAQLRHTQQLEALGTLAGGIAHDFNNILAAIFAYVELAQLDAEKPDQVRGHLSELQSAADRARDLVQQILTFSRRQVQERSPTRLQQVAQEALKLLRSTLPSTIEIQVEIDWQAPVVLATPIHIHQVMFNLCMNAVQAMRGAHGRLSLSLETVQLGERGSSGAPELPPGRYVCLRVSDTGHGMSPATQRRIFEPFFTTKGPGEGTGLGLALVQGIVRDHEGAVHVESEPELGSTFSVYLPAHEWVEQRIEKNLSEQAPGRGEHILLVDDEPVLCEASRSVLERIGYRVTTYTQPQRALEAFRQAPLDFDIVITDLTMPQLTGTELARKVNELRPAMPVLLVSGLWSGLAPADLRAFGVRDVLPKPLNSSALAVAVRRALDAQS